MFSQVLAPFKLTFIHGGGGATPLGSVLREVPVPLLIQPGLLPCRITVICVGVRKGREI